LHSGSTIARGSRVIAAPIVLALVTAAGGHAADGRHVPRVAPDRAQLVDALERLVRTGEPRHVTHDDGQELDAALKEALASGADRDLSWLATRAAVPIVPAIQHPLSSRTRPGALTVRAERVLTLPWTVDYVASIDARLDGGRWQEIFRLKSGASESRSLGAVLPAAGSLTTGFHTLALRARIRYGQLPAEMPRRETRDLLTVQYGVWGSAKIATDAVRPFIDSATSVSAALLDPKLPDIPFSSWVAQLPHDVKDRSALDWRTEWCGVHDSMSDEGLVPGDVCVVARRGGTGHFTEIWLKVGTLRNEEGKARWVGVSPALAAAYLYHGPRVRVPLAAVPEYLSQQSDDGWPSARLVVNSAGISVASPNIAPGVPTMLRVLVANMGDADANGITIDVVAASETNLPAMRRAFVRTIRAGGSVEIETPVTFPARYGIVNVVLRPGHDQVWPRVATAHENHTAFAVINQRAAPAGYLQRLCLEDGNAGNRVFLRPALDCIRSTPY
jgi:hypothetical protein